MAHKSITTEAPASPCLCRVRKALDYTSKCRRYLCIQMPAALSSILILVLLLSGCDVLPPRRPVSTSHTVTSPTALPTPAVSVSSTDTLYYSHGFYTSPRGWFVQWAYDCRAALRRQHTWKWVLVAHQVRRRSREQQATLIAARPLASSSARFFPPRNHGMVAGTISGYIYLRIATSRGCSWSVRTVENH